MTKPRLIIGISGASGARLGVRVLDACAELGLESHLIVSKAAALTLTEEAGLSLAEAQARATVVHKLADVGAAIASSDRHPAPPPPVYYREPPPAYYTGPYYYGYAGECRVHYRWDSYYRRYVEIERCY